MRKSLSIIALVLFSTIAAAATVGIMPDPVYRSWNSTGTAVLAGGYVVTCPAGTTCGCSVYTDQATYTDYTGTVANTNPVYLNSRGEASIWLKSGVSYKITICDMHGNQQKSTDGVVAIEQVSAPEAEIWQSIGATPTFLNATQFSVLGDYTSVFTTGRRLKSVVSAGTVYSTVSTTAPVYATGITTVTVVNDSTALDSGLLSVSINIIDNKAGMSTNVPGTIVARDNSGNFAAGLITTTGISSSGVFTSTVPIGTAPLVVTSTTKVTNLYADTASKLSDGTNAIKTKIIDIGDWNMDTTDFVDIPHGLTQGKIRGATGVIRTDDNTLYFNISPGFGSLYPIECEITSITSTAIRISRRVGGYFDGGVYSSTSYNRGWLTITYIE